MRRQALTIPFLASQTIADRTRQGLVGQPRAGLITLARGADPQAMFGARAGQSCQRGAVGDSMVGVAA